MPMMKDVRFRKNKTQQQVADATMLTVPVISRMENGKPVSRKSFLLVCQFLGVDPETIEGVNVTDRRGPRAARGA